MPEFKLNLTKLATGRRFVTGGSQTLWLGDDYLLLQISTRFTERVRRFYYADIQSIVYARTSVGRDVSVACAIMAAAIILLGMAVGSGEGMSSAGLFIAALALFPLLGLGVNLVAGPTCACAISTAVHTERVLALNRIAKVERVIGQIVPRIDAVQGRLSGEMLEADQPEAASVEPGRHALEGNAGRVELHHEQGTFHRIVYLLCLVSSVSHAVGIFLQDTVKGVFDGLLFAALIIFVLIALRRQKNSDLTGAVKNLTPVILAVAAVSFFGSMFLGFYFFILNPTRSISEGAQGMGLMPMLRDSMATQMFLVFCTVSFALAGVVGLMRLARGGAVPPAVETGFAVPSEAGDESP